MSDGTRDAARTTHAILEAAVQLICERGSGVSIAEIATAAGISKGGLLHHFKSRDTLLYAVAKDVLSKFRAQVERNLDLSERHPGRMVRAYVRALCGNDPTARELFESYSLWHALHATPGVELLLKVESERWHSEFKLDGLHPDRILVVQHAAEGIAASARHDAAVTTEYLEHAVSTLTQFTTENVPITPLRMEL